MQVGGEACQTLDLVACEERSINYAVSPEGDLALSEEIIGEIQNIAVDYDVSFGPMVRMTRVIGIVHCEANSRGDWLSPEAKFVLRLTAKKFQVNLVKGAPRNRKAALSICPQGMVVLIPP
jgi:hypothetical protein